jgi:hypothetical protein
MISGFCSPCPRLFNPIPLPTGFSNGFTVSAGSDDVMTLTSFPVLAVSALKSRLQAVSRIHTTAISSISLPVILINFLRKNLSIIYIIIFREIVAPFENIF